jgi:hypothetical protein
MNIIVMKKLERAQIEVKNRLCRLLDEAKIHASQWPSGDPLEKVRDWMDDPKSEGMEMMEACCRHGLSKPEIIHYQRCTELVTTEGQALLIMAYMGYIKACDKIIIQIAGKVREMAEENRRESKEGEEDGI